MCMKKSYFQMQRNKICFEHEQKMSWRMLISILTCFAQVVEILLPMNGDVYGYFHEILTVLNLLDVNKWIKQQNENWISVLFE